MNDTSLLTILREILAPIIGGIAGFLGAHGLSLTSDQQAAAATLGATAVVALERYVARLIAPQKVTTLADKPDPAKAPPSPPASPPPAAKS